MSSKLEPLNQSGPGGSPSEQGTFDLHLGTGTGGLTVVSFRGRERMSRTYRFDVDFTSDLEPAVLEPLAVGQRATLLLRSAHGGSRVITGIATRFSAHGTYAASGKKKYGVRIEPRVALLKRAKRSRIFQNKTVAETVSAVLDEWKIPHRWNLTKTYPSRPYCVQYQESDYDFVARLLSEEGIFFLFQAPPELLDPTWTAVAAGALDTAKAVAGALGETGPLASADTSSMTDERMVFSDSSVGYPAVLDPAASPLGALATLAGGALLDAARDAAADNPLSSSLLAEVTIAAPKAIPFRARGAHPSASDHIVELAYQRRLKTKAVELREYYYLHPNLPLVASASVSARQDASTLSPLALSEPVKSVTANVHDAAASAVRAVSDATVATSLGTTPLEWYEHQGDYEEPDVNRHRARVRLEQLRGRVRVVRGQGNVRRFAAGHRFRLDEHPQDLFNVEYVLTEVRHSGTIPELSETPGAMPSSVYHNEFVCAPSRTVVRPRRVRRVQKQVVETAVVVGPVREELFTDEHGRIKVQFHWDRDGKKDEHSSCWIRAAQAWSGVGWGFQFIPRIGMEVVVTFLFGDEDRPLVTGAVYNQTHPTPFLLPQDKSRSGIRTQSLLLPKDAEPSSSRLDRRYVGFNELSFDDTYKNEQIYIHGERDVELVVERRSTIRVGESENHYVRRNREVTVEGNQTTTISGRRFTKVEEDDHCYVESNKHLSVVGSDTTRVDETRTALVFGRDKLEVHADAARLHHDDLLTEVKGCVTTIVGTEDEPRSHLVHVEGMSNLFSTDVTEIESEKAILLRCGDSSVLVGPKSIDFCSPNLLFSSTTSKTHADTIKLQGKASALAIDENFLVTAPQILMQCAPIEEALEHKLTESTVTLTDPDGKPLSYQRFVIEVGELRVAGVTDKDGRAVRHGIEGTGSVVFPGALGAKKKD